MVSEAMCQSGVDQTDDTDLHHGCAKLNLRRQLSSPVIGDLIQVAPDTLPEHNFLLPDFQYGEPAEVFGTAAALTIQASLLHALGIS